MQKATRHLGHGTIMSFTQDAFSLLIFKVVYCRVSLWPHFLLSVRLYVLWGFVVLATSVTKAAKRKVSHHCDSWTAASLQRGERWWHEGSIRIFFTACLKAIVTEPYERWKNPRMPRIHLLFRAVKESLRKEGTKKRTFVLKRQSACCFHQIRLLNPHVGFT